MEDEGLMVVLVESFGHQSHRGRKKKLVCRGERKVHGDSRWSIGGCAGFLWWSWWWLLLVTRTTRGERERKKLKKWGIEANFWLTLDPISPNSGHEIHLYLLAGEEGNLVYIAEKLQLLIWLERIPIVGSK